MSLLETTKNRIYRFIYRLQLYFKVDFFYLIKGEFWLIIGKMTGMTASFLLALAWANWIDKSVYGSYQYILSLMGLVSIFTLPEMGTAVIQAVARNLEGSFIRGLKTQLKWGGLGSLSAVGIAGYYWLQGNKNVSYSLLIIAIFLPFFQAFQLYVSFLQGKKLFDIQVKYSALAQIFSASVMIIALFLINRFFLKMPISLIVAIIVFISLFSKTIVHIFFWFRTKRKFQPNTKEDTHTISFGKHLTFAGVISALAEHLDSILLFHYLGATELAIYSFAMLVPNQINTFLKHVSVLALPKFAVRSREELKKTLLRKIYYLSLLIGFITLFYIIIAPFVYQIFFPQYSNSIPYSKLYALSIIPLAFSMGAVFRAKMMTKEIYQIKIAVPIVKIILVVILIPLYGVWGAIWSILGSRIFNGFLSISLFKKRI